MEQNPRPARSRSRPPARWAGSAAKPPKRRGGPPPATRRQAPQDIKPCRGRLRNAIEEVLQVRGPMTSDEVAAVLKEHWGDIRPRFTELSKDGKVEDTGDRRPSARGNPAIVWRLVAVKLEQGDMMADLLPPVVTR